MAKKWFLQSTVVPQNRFEIVKFDKATGKATLRTEKATFEQVIAQDELDRLHYVVVSEEVEDD